MKAERLILATALIAGSSYIFADRFDTTTPLMIAWKGAGVTLLALWCAVQARQSDGWLIAAVMAFGAAGDVLLEAAGLAAGAAAFFLGHVLAVWLYLRNRRQDLTRSQTALCLALLIGVPVVAWLISSSIDVAGYATALGIMAAAAWASRFPRYRVGLGAVLFVASDLLIFARMGPLVGSAWTGFLIWPLYFAGQALIATGVVNMLRKGRTMLELQPA